MWSELLTAVALVLVIEGIVPFLSPGGWKRMVMQFLRVSDQTLRLIGLTSMIIGVLLLYLAR